MPSQKNITALATLKDRFAEAKAILFADYHGLSVADMVKLRAKIAEATGEFSVAKNTLLKLALKDRGLPLKIEEILRGPTAILIAREDEIEPLKALVTFSEANENIPVVKAAILFTPPKPSGEGGDDHILSAEEVIKLAHLPGRLELQAKVVGLLAAPTRGLVTVLSGNLRHLVGVLNAHKEKLSSPNPNS